MPIKLFVNVASHSLRDKHVYNSPLLLDYFLYDPPFLLPAGMAQTFLYHIAGE